MNEEKNAQHCSHGAVQKRVDEEQDEEFDVCRVHSEESLIAKNLSMFIGLILRNELFIRTKQLRDKTK